MFDKLFSSLGEFIKHPSKGQGILMGVDVGEGGEWSSWDYCTYREVFKWFYIGSIIPANNYPTCVIQCEAHDFTYSHAVSRCDCVWRFDWPHTPPPRHKRRRKKAVMKLIYIFLYGVNIQLTWGSPKPCYLWSFEIARWMCCFLSIACFIDGIYFYDILYSSVDIATVIYLSNWKLQK